MQSFEIPMDVKLLAGRRDLLDDAMSRSQMTILRQRGDDLYSRFSSLNAEEKESGDGKVLDNVMHIVNLEAGGYGSLGKVMLSTSSKLQVPP